MFRFFLFKRDHLFHRLNVKKVNPESSLRNQAGSFEMEETEVFYVLLWETLVLNLEFKFQLTTHKKVLLASARL